MLYSLYFYCVEQRFSNFGTRTTEGTRVTFRGYASSFKVEIGRKNKKKLGESRNYSIVLALKSKVRMLLVKF